MEKSQAEPTPYVRFLNLVRAMDKAPAFPELDPTEERLLQLWAIAWGAGKRITVVEVMNTGSEFSPTTVHRRIKSLKAKGFIKLEMDESDNRVKYVLPTQLADKYFGRLSDCLIAATVPGSL